MLFCNNHTAFHMRTEFRDWPEPERRRHLLRLWLSLPNSRRLPDTFAEFFGDIAAGAVRGGYPSRDGVTRSRRPEPVVVVVTVVALPAQLAQ